MSITVFALVMEPRNFDALVRQRDAQQWKNVFVEHGKVEFDTVADRELLRFRVAVGVAEGAGGHSEQRRRSAWQR
ncbi:hypothetical protein ACKWRH_34080 [Bradyrhizobium sp. Pa8]|uniref:hypothetical protein n=1 Tax=Bradyrhizobium sp. Pa8 TaxID=3386552 RepID=UPI00403F78E8